MGILVDYRKIEQAIDFIRQQSHRQPDLDEIASSVHLSQHHFQRLFSRWVGLSPKKVLQILTLERAKYALSKSQTVQSAAWEVGLSSSSRLYDHFVVLEAVTPAEYKSCGEGLVFEYGVGDTPFGRLFIAYTPRGICQLSFIEQSCEQELLALRGEWHNAKFKENKSAARSLIDSLFDDKPKEGLPISLWVKGTNFQVSVWRALLYLQPGNVASYQTIAHHVNKPKAHRAVGTAIGANPIAWLIPCHRVIRQSGALGGYRWGLNRKHAMLAREFALK